MDSNKAIQYISTRHVWHECSVLMLDHESRLNQSFCSKILKASGILLHVFPTRVCFRQQHFFRVSEHLLLAFSETWQYWYQTVHVGNV